MVIAQEHFGPDHPHVAMVANNLGAALLQLDQAEALQSEIAERQLVAEFE